MQTPSERIAGLTPHQRNVLIGFVIAVALFVFWFLFQLFSASTMGVSYSQASVPQMGMYALSANDSAYVNQKGGGAGSRIVSESYSGAPVYAPAPTMPGASTPTIPSERKVIMTGNLTLLVKKAPETASEIRSIVTASGGFVENSNFYGNGRVEQMGQMTVRVPSTTFDEVMGKIKALALRVDSESSNANDVSAQYVDLESSLRNYRVEETQYQEIMKGAKKTEEILQIARALSEVRGKIENIQGQLNYLSRQVSMSTISITLSPEANPIEQTGGWRPITIAKEALRGMFAELIDIANNLIALVIWLPVFILRIGFYILIAWALYWVGRKLYRRLMSPQLPPASGGV